MNKVLVVGFTHNPGGIESVIMNYYRNIDRNILQFDFLKNTKLMAYEDEIRELGGKIYEFTPKSKSFFKYKKELKSIFKEHAKEYQAIWVNFCEITNLDYLKLAKKYKIKIRILHSHNSNNMASFTHLLLHKINKKFIKRYVTNYWACSTEAAKWFYDDKILNDKKYKIINNAINIDDFKYDEKIRNSERKALNISSKALVIGNVGRLQYQKNHEFLIRIFRKIKDKRKDAILVIIGDGVEKENIEKEVKSLGLENDVIMLGTIKDVNNKLQLMDIFVFPSRFEGLSVTLFEAQANGLKCFVSKDVIAKESKVSNNLEYISLDRNAEFWANKVLNCNYKRVDNTNNIKKSGYDIKDESIKLQNFFVGRGGK